MTSNKGNDPFPHSRMLELLSQLPHECLVCSQRSHEDPYLANLEWSYITVECSMEQNYPHHAVSLQLWCSPHQPFQHLSPPLSPGTMASRWHVVLWTTLEQLHISQKSQIISNLWLGIPPLKIPVKSLKSEIILEYFDWLPPLKNMLLLVFTVSERWNEIPSIHSLHLQVWRICTFGCSSVELWPPRV